MEHVGEFYKTDYDQSFSALSVEPLNGTRSLPTGLWQLYRLSVLSLLSR